MPKGAIVALLAPMVPGKSTTREGDLRFVENRRRRSHARRGPVDGARIDGIDTRQIVRRGIFR